MAGWLLLWPVVGASSWMAHRHENVRLVKRIRDVVCGDANGPEAQAAFGEISGEQACPMDARELEALGMRLAKYSCASTYLYECMLGLAFHVCAMSLSMYLPVCMLYRNASD